MKRTEVKPEVLKGYLGSVEFDGATVTIRKKMRGQVRIPIGQIAAVVIVPAGIGMGGIRFDVAGGTTQRRVAAVGSHKDIASDPQALTFLVSRRAEFEKFASRVEDAISAARERPVNMPNDPQSAGTEEPAPIPPHMQLGAAMAKVPRSKRAAVVKLVSVAFAVFIFVIVFAAINTSRSGSSKAAPPASPPAGCLAASNDDGPFETWLNNLTQAKFTTSARLVADGGTYLAARLDNADKDVVVWWERAGNDKGAQGVYAADVKTFTLTWLGQTDMVNSNSPGYDQVKLCLG